MLNTFEKSKIQKEYDKFCFNRLSNALNLRIEQLNKYYNREDILIDVPASILRGPNPLVPHFLELVDEVYPLCTLKYPESDLQNEIKNSQAEQDKNDEPTFSGFKKGFLLGKRF